MKIFGFVISTIGLAAMMFTMPDDFSMIFMLGLIFWVNGKFIGRD